MTRLPYPPIRKPCFIAFTHTPTLPGVALEFAALDVVAALLPAMVEETVAGRMFEF